MTPFQHPAAIDALPYGFLEIDADDRVVVWNQRLVQWTRRTAETVLGRKLAELYPGEAGLHRVLKRARKARQPQVLSQAFHKYFIPVPLPPSHLSGFEHMQQDCCVVPLAARPGCLAITITDVTSHVVGQSRVKAIQKELLVACEREGAVGRALANQKSALDKHAIVGVTDRRGVITYVNDKFCAISGYSRDELIGKDHRIINSGHHPKEFFREMWSTITAGGVWKGEVRNLAKDWGIYWVATTIVPFLDDAGKPEQFIAIRTDITALKQAEVELRAAMELAEAANRAKSEFLATMSHEIRTPMNGVLGFAQLLRDTALTGEQAGYVETITSSGELLLAIINDILDLSKIESGNMKLEEIPFDFGRTANDVVSLLSAQAKAKGLTLTLDFETGMPRSMTGDPCRVRQVLLNLAGNAIKFTSSGSVSITVRMENAPQVAGNKGFLRVAVADSGIGISAAKMGVLFQKFAQADSSTTRRFGGTGLGLAISKRLVELMGGEIGVESVEGRGSTFWFRLPLPACAPAVSTLAAPKTGSERTPGLPPAGQSLRVLVAESDPTNQLLATTLLQRMGCAVDVAANGRAAVEMVEKAAYDLVLMDWNLPGLSGLDATREIRSREGDVSRSRLPVIALAAGEHAEDHQRCLAVGMDDILNKPVRTDALLRVISKWVAEPESPTRSP